MRYTVDRESKTITILSEENPLEEIIEVTKMYQGYHIASEKA